MAALYTARYLAYCKAQGTPDPDAMLELDRERYPGGKMAGFSLWIAQRWVDWRVAHGVKVGAPLSGQDHASFDAWLDEE